MPAGKHNALIKAWRRRERRQDERAALVAQAVRNSNGGKGKGRGGYSIADIIGEFEDA